MAQHQIPRLGIRHLTILQAISRWGTVAAAAEQLKVTPSAVTHRMREAERRLGCRLTGRHGNRVRLTVAGERLALSAERVIDEMLRAELDAGRIGRDVKSIVRLGMGIYTFFHWLPSLLGHLSKVHDGMQLDVVSDATYEPLRQLQDGAVDILLLPGEHQGKGTTLFPLFTDELVCVMAKTHRWAGRDSIMAEDLTAETHLTYSAVEQAGFEYDQFMRPAGHYPARLVTISQPEAVLELVSAGLGISILARWAVEPRLEAGKIVAARLTPKGLPVRWQVAIRDTEPADSPATQCARAILDWGARLRSKPAAGPA